MMVSRRKRHTLLVGDFTRQDYSIVRSSLNEKGIHEKKEDIL